MPLSKYFCFSFLCLIALSRSATAQYSGPTAGQKVAFLGDSITQFGWDHPAGYVHLVDLALAQEGHKIEVIPAGIGGQTSKDMLARIGTVLSKHPDWMLLSCGVNDVWHGEAGVPLDQYKMNITSIVDQAKAAGVKVVILASPPLGSISPTRTIPSSLLITTFCAASRQRIISLLLTSIPPWSKVPPS